MIGLLLLASTPSQVFDSIERSHAGFKRGSVQISVMSRLPGRAVDTKFRLDLDGKGQIVLRVQEPARGPNDRSDRTYCLNGDRLTAYDALANETLSRRVSMKPPLADRMMSAVGQLEDPVQVLISPPFLHQFLIPFRALGGFRVIKTPTGTVLDRAYRGSGGNTDTQFRLSKSGLIQSFLITAPGSKLLWTLNYSAAPVPFSVPKTARRVEAFTVRPALSNFATPTARAIAERMLRSQGRLALATILVRGDDGVSRVILGGGKYREENSSGAWTFDGKILTIRSGNALYRGPAKRREIVALLAAAGVRIEPMLRQVVLRQLPFQDVFETGSMAKEAGEIKLNGVSCVILQVTSDRIRTSVMVRKPDGLLQSIGVDTLDQTGATVIHSDRTYTYSAVGQSAPSASFSLPPKPGERVRPLLPIPER